MAGCATVERDWPSLAGEWQLVAMAGEAGEGLAPISLTVSGAGEFGGNAGCNRYFGRFSGLPAKATAGPVGSTRRACPGPVMAQESRYLALLERVETLERRGSSLLLKGAGESVLAELTSTPGLR